MMNVDEAKDPWNRGTDEQGMLKCGDPLRNLPALPGSAVKRVSEVPKKDDLPMR